MDEGLENLEIQGHDFTVFHPLDHSLLACDGRWGGRRRHIKTAWHFRWLPTIKAQTLCRLGRHQMAPLSRSGDPISAERVTVGEICINCEFLAK